MCVTVVKCIRCGVVWCPAVYGVCGGGNGYVRWSDCMCSDAGCVCVSLCVCVCGGGGSDLVSQKE
jgi:hypothetical protein